LYGGEAHEHRGLLGRVLEETCLGQLGVGFVGFEETVGCGTAGMDDSLWNTLMVKMRDFLAHDEVFQQRRATCACFQGVLVVADLDALVGAQGLAGRVRAKLLKFVELGVVVGAIRRVGTGELARRSGRWGRFHMT
jgi:hypothetical protein